jgi:chromosomal replication initiator protein
VRDVSPDQIEDAVAKAFGVSVAELHSKTRQRRVTDPRQVAMYLEKQLLDMPYTHIGRRFGGRDHSTVIHSIQRVEAQLLKDEVFREKVESLRADFR